MDKLDELVAFLGIAGGRAIINPTGHTVRKYDMMVDVLMLALDGMSDSARADLAESCGRVLISNASVVTDALN